MRQEVADLRDDGSVFSNEKALMCLYNPEKDEEDTIDQTACALFQNCSLAACTEQSKFIVMQRIKAIQKIHKIRQIFAQQCFIGIVGLQDAGKTTLLKKVSEIKHTYLFCILFKFRKYSSFYIITMRSGIYLQIWGVGGKTGLFSHTDVPMMYEISRRLYVVDFPGSNSLDYHAKTFSICGAMNNMIILILPFTGDVSQIISEEVAQVFSVMKGSDATQVSTTNTYIRTQSIILFL